MLISPTGKHKIDLSDYDYRRDIENRLLMSQFSIFEVDVLRELVYGSIRTSVQHLADALSVSREQILTFLDKLTPTGLVQHDNERIVLDKEMRKYYEFQIVKFDDDFEPGIDFLRTLLNKVPIDILPSWYVVPRMSDNIIDSIIEKHLATPKVYRHYLNELEFDDPVLRGIMEDVFAAPSLKIRSKALREKYDLTREQFEEYMLHLEFNFVCSLSYNHVDDMWKEVVTPFHEWREFLVFQQESQPQSIADVDNIKRRYEGDFGFVEAMTSILEQIDSTGTFSRDEDDPFQGHAYDKLISLHFVQEVDGQLSCTAEVADWLQLSLPNKAIALYRNPFNRVSGGDLDSDLLTDRNIRLAEKSVKRVMDSGWIYFDDFTVGVISPIGQARPIALQRVGRGRWQYARPSYSEQESLLIKRTVMQRFCQIGIVACGTHDGKDCFCVTPFGHTIL